MVEPMLNNNKTNPLTAVTLVLICRGAIALKGAKTEQHLSSQFCMNIQL